MVKTCCVRFCKSESYGGCGISFHSFPKDEKTKEIWLNVVPVIQKITKYSVVCSHHFKIDDFYTTGSRLFLKANVIPSVFPKVQNKQSNIAYSQLQSTFQPIAHDTPGTSKDYGVSEEYTPPAKKICSEVKDVEVQTDTLRSSPSKDMLQRKVKMLSQKLKRRDVRIDRMKSLLAILKKKSNNFDEV